MKKIEKIKIRNYRKLKNVDIYLDENMTVIAGSNNAGKTSIVELFSKIFRKDTGKSMSIEDIHSQARMEDIDKIKGIIREDSTYDDKISKLLNIHKQLSSIKVDIDIKYDDTDDISLFSDYLMDVDENKRNFYFRYELKYEPVEREFLESNIENEEKVVQSFKYLTSVYNYCDEERNIVLPIDSKSNFSKLFNFECVYAVRNLSDTSDEKKYFLSKHLLNTVKENKDWKSGLNELVEDINTTLESRNLSNKIDEITINAIVETLDSFSKTNGGHTGQLGVDFRLDNQDIEKILLDFVKVHYTQEDSTKIYEQKQGLGYSNLIYLLLTIQSFRQGYDAKRVNLLFFEEPEAHLHPQMENVFIRHLCGVDDGFQMLITTHSSEIAKTVSIDNIRVLRSIKATCSKIYDLKSFMKVELNDLPELQTFYNKFFQFSMIEIIFADKVILFEGDAERLMIKFIIATSDSFNELANQYISYIQVGGAYAYQYINLVSFLEVKTLILSDIDYEYDSKIDLEKSEEEMIENIKQRKSTNETIKHIVGKNQISEIYQVQESVGENRNIVHNGNICLKFQGKSEGYARTLEDAILHKILNVDENLTVFKRYSKESIKNITVNNNFLISNPKNDFTTLRDRIEKLQSKTDFMYSLIENQQADSIMPVYIEEGLKWLQR